MSRADYDTVKANPTHVGNPSSDNHDGLYKFSTSQTTTMNPAGFPPPLFNGDYQTFEEGAKIKKHFIRRIYSLLCIQLTITFAMCLLLKLCCLLVSTR